MILNIQRQRIENAVLKVNRELENKNDKILSWKKFPEEELFSELVFCILGSRVSFEKAKSAGNKLKRLNLLKPKILLNDLRVSKNLITKTLKNDRYPFAKSKSTFITKTAKNIYKINNSSIKKILLKAKNELEAREMLVCTCMGIGYKQASLFLRNIHYSENLAILDTHVLKYMGLMGLFNNRHNKTITKKHYSLYERKLMNYSNNLNTTLSKLDVAIWVVMRVVRREFPWML